MLQKFYLKIKDRKVSIFYIESKNFTFSEDRVFNKDFEQIKIDKKLFERATSMIVHNLHFPEDTIFCYDEYDIGMGSMIKTPEHLL